MRGRRSRKKHTTNNNSPKTNANIANDKAGRSNNRYDNQHNDDQSQSRNLNSKRNQSTKNNNKGPDNLNDNHTGPMASPLRENSSVPRSRASRYRTGRKSRVTNPRNRRNNRNRNRVRKENQGSAAYAASVRQTLSNRARARRGTDISLLAPPKRPRTNEYPVSRPIVAKKIRKNRSHTEEKDAEDELLSNRTGGNGAGSSASGLPRRRRRNRRPRNNDLDYEMSQREHQQQADSSKRKEVMEQLVQLSSLVDIEVDALAKIIFPRTNVTDPMKSGVSPAPNAATAEESATVNKEEFVIATDEGESIRRQLVRQNRWSAKRNQDLRQDQETNNEANMIKPSSSRVQSNSKGERASRENRDFAASGSNAISTHDDEDEERELEQQQEQQRLEKVKKRKLVFLADSPNYCRTNLAEGTQGVLGRTCSAEPGNPSATETVETCTRLCKQCGFKVS